MLRKTALFLFVTLASAAVGARQPRTVSLVITNGVVVTVDRDKRVIERGIVAVDTAARIAAEYRGRDTIDAAGGVIMPGLINTHTHAPMVMFRGLADDL